MPKDPKKGPIRGPEQEFGKAVDAAFVIFEDISEQLNGKPAEVALVTAALILRQLERIGASPSRALLMKSVEYVMETIAFPTDS